MPSWPGRMKANQDLPRPPAGTAMSFVKLKWHAAAPMPRSRAAATSTEMVSAGDPVDGMGQGNVLLAQPADVMGREPNGDGIVAVGPIRMVPRFLGGQRHPRHEGEGFRKIPERKAALDHVTSLVMRPALETAEALAALLGTEFFDHLASPAGLALPRLQFARRVPKRPAILLNWCSPSHRETPYSSHPNRHGKAFLMPDGVFIDRDKGD